MSIFGTKYKNGVAESAPTFIEGLIDDTDTMFHDRIVALQTARDGASSEPHIQNAYNQQIRMLRQMREQAMQAYGTAVGRGSSPAV